MKVGVIGLGKAGLPLAAVIADSGIEVIGVDISKERCEEINQGQNPIPEEPGLLELIKKYAGNNIIAVPNYEQAADCTAYIVIVPLFIDDNKKPDFSILENAFTNISKILKDGDLVVLETTVPPGTTQKLLKPILDKAGRQYHLAYSPERIMTGYSISRYREFPKVIGGIDNESGKKGYDLYSNFCTKVNLVTDAKTAELIKVAEGVYRDVNIAVANELYKVSEKLGIDYYEVREFANHEFCNLHVPGNVGGHCIPVYPWFLINDFSVPVIKAARNENDGMIEYYYEKVKAKQPEGKILVIGISYRENVKETAYTRSIPFIHLLKDKGYDVYVYDPMYSQKEIEDFGFKFLDIKDQKKADLAVVMNSYPDVTIDIAAVHIKKQ